MRNPTPLHIPGKTSWIPSQGKSASALTSSEKTSEICPPHLPEVEDRGNPRSLPLSVRLGTGLSLILLLSSCTSLLFGNIKPFEEKSSTYSLGDLSQKNPRWVQVQSSSTEPSPEGVEPHLIPNSGAFHLSQVPASERSDILYQDQKTGSTISVNSACKNYSRGSKKRTLKHLSDELILGVFQPATKTQQEFRVDHHPALRTIATGSLHHQEITLETIVFQIGGCTYDLIYIARSHSFQANEDDFLHFVSTFHAK